MATTAGSLALVGAKPPKDAFLVDRLRKAGAVVLGKTNLSEWANFRSSFSTSGWSGRGGLTRNPYALDRNPSGSSSGSAAAVAASLCAAAVGTETDGSIVRPVVGQRRRRNQADRRPGQPLRRHPHFAQPGHAGADGPHRPRRGGPARRPRRRGPRRRGDEGRPRQGRRLHALPRRGRPQGGARRRRAQPLRLQRRRRRRGGRRDAER